jgi:hypothetical protein
LFSTVGARRHPTAQAGISWGNRVPPSVNPYGSVAVGPVVADFLNYAIAPPVDSNHQIKEARG